MSDADGSDVEEEVEGSVTTTSEVRWKHLSTAVTLLVTFAYIAVVFAQMFGPALGVDVGKVSNGSWATFSLAFIAALAYSVGVDTIKAAKDVMGK